MKILYCIKCDSIVRLTTKHRQCECGGVWGKYVDELNAIYYWNPFIMWLDNNSFWVRLRKDIQENFLYNLTHKLELDNTDIKCFTFWKSSFCSWWKCNSSLSKLTKKDYDNLQKDKKII